MPRTFAILAVLIILAACDTSNETTAVDTAQQAAKHVDIAWFDGTIEEAFAAAREQDKPLFFYWGAVWCPPCQEIKSTVFKSQAFIELTNLFVPVYLDGDTVRAQSYGEKFGVKGYPTMIVFSPSGEEVTRLPGGIEIEKYNDVLSLALDQMRPTIELVRIAIDDAAQLTQKELQQLAYYSWGQDATAVPKEADMASVFLALADLAEDKEVSTRFYLEYLLALATAEDKTTVLVEDNAAERLRAILASEQLTIAGWGTLAYWSEEILALPALSSDKELARQWADRVFNLRFNEKLSKAEKLAGWFPYLAMLTMNDSPLPEEVAASLREELAQVDADTPDPYERQSVVNQMSHVYRIAGLHEDARQLLLAELERSASPYYFMSGLAAMAEDEEKIDEAIEWRRKAWETAEGEATRFQWGTGYVQALVRMQPSEKDLITATAGQLLSSFADPNELFAGRNFKRLQRLNRQLGEWQKQAGVSLLAFHEAIETLCNNQVPNSQLSTNCQSLVKEEDDSKKTLARAS